MARKNALEEQGHIPLGKGGVLDSELYGGDDGDNFVRELPTAEEEAQEARNTKQQPAASSVSGPASLRNEVLGPEDGGESLQRIREAGGSGMVNTRIADREGDVRAPAAGRVVCLAAGTGRRAAARLVWARHPASAAR